MQAAIIAARPKPTAMQTPPPTAAPQPAASVLPRKYARRRGTPGRPVAGASTRSAARGAAVPAAASRPIWDVATASKTVAASAGNGNSAGPGAGSGTQGGGTGAASGAPPCGYVTFSDPHGSHFDPRTHGFWVDIRMSVHFADGSAQSMILDYPWYYSSEAANPWSSRNVNDPNFPTRFQPPPSERSPASRNSEVRHGPQHARRRHDIARLPDAFVDAGALTFRYVVAGTGRSAAYTGFFQYVRVRRRD